jgi:hypothetical protein
MNASAQRARNAQRRAKTKGVQSSKAQNTTTNKEQKKKKRKKKRKQIKLS